MQLIARVGLIGDLHAEDETLAFVLGELDKLGAETLLQVGDIADGPGDLSRTIGLLREHHVLAVRGNHDRWLLGDQLRDLPRAQARDELSAADLELLRELPVTREFCSARGQVLLCHGLGTNDMLGVKPHHEGSDISSNTELQQLIAERRYRFVLNGHTHRPMFRSFGPLSIINAGTLLRDYERCFTLVDFEGGELRRFRQAAESPVRLALDAWVEQRLTFDDSPPGLRREPGAAPTDY
jgi:predicted phosphodiesterase